MSRSHSVVVPTAVRDLPLLRRVVASVRAQSMPVREVVVVAAADVPEVDATVVRVTRNGTAGQRNAGLDQVTSDVVHFVDDDVLLAPDYIAMMDRAYDAPGVVGATGNLFRTSPAHVVRPVTRRWLQRHPEPGQVSRAGVAAPIDTDHGDHDVAWMPAAAMSMRTDLGRTLRFDEVLERGPTGPYALHEDVDLTHRLARHGRLRFVSAARAEHLGADTWRLAWPAYWEMRTLSRRYLSGKPGLGLSRAHARAYLAVDLALVSYLVVAGRSRPSCLAAAVRGVVGVGLDRRPAP